MDVLASEDLCVPTPQTPTPAYMMATITSASLIAPPRNTTLLPTVCILGGNWLFLPLYKHCFFWHIKYALSTCTFPPQIPPLRRTCRPIWQNPTCQIILLPNGQLARLLRKFPMFSFYLPAGASASVSPSLLSAVSWAPRVLDTCISPVPSSFTWVAFSSMWFPEFIVLNLPCPPPLGHQQNYCHQCLWPG